MFKILKQELIFLPLMLILVEVFRRTIVTFYPDTALFDRGSELETFLFRVWQIVWITSSSWLLLRVTFPSAYKALKSFYLGFGRMDETTQRSFSMKLFCIYFFGLVFLLSGKAATETQVRAKLTDTLNSQLLVRELTGNNDGVEVERYLKYVGQTKGAAWCAAFVSWNLNAVGVSTPPNPKSAWSPNFAKQPYVVYSAKLNKQHKLEYKLKAGDCFTLYYPNLERVGHVGFIIAESGNYYITVEGNTGTNGTREGSGVHKMKRAKDKVFAITNYITPFIHEKTINSLPFNVPSNGFVLSKNNGKHRENYGLNQCGILQSRYCNNARYNDSDSCGFVKNISGDRLTNKFTKADCGKYQDETNLANKKRESYSRLYLQGTGTESTVAGKTNIGTNSIEPPEEFGQKQKGNKASKIYTQMGKNIGLDWRYWNASIYHIHSV